MRVLFMALLTCLATNLFANSIWHVSGEREFYLFGTIHVLKPEAYPLANAFDRTIAQCDALWLEVDMNEMTDATVMHQVQNKMLLPVGDQLKDQLSEQDYAKLGQLGQIAGVPLGLLQGLKPWAAVNQLTLMIFQQRGFTGEGLDMYLHRVAQEKGIPLIGLESLLWQIEMFDTLAQQDQGAFINFSTEDLDNVEQMVDDMYQQWQSGDYQTLYTSAQLSNYPNIEDVLLTQRNNNWMQQLSKPAQGTQCVAVGLLHMAGEHGLVAQFKAAGYQVTQVQ